MSIMKYEKNILLNLFFIFTFCFIKISKLEKEEIHNLAELFDGILNSFFPNYDKHSFLNSVTAELKEKNCQINVIYSFLSKNKLVNPLEKQPSTHNECVIKVADEIMKLDNSNKIKKSSLMRK